MKFPKINLKKLLGALGHALVKKYGAKIEQKADDAIDKAADKLKGGVGKAIDRAGSGQ